MSSFQINDPVTAVVGGATLEGVVLYTDGTKLGIRLTGTSAGKGDHNGTVSGTEYFAAPDKCGILLDATSGVVTKRTLTKLQELRLRRELGKSSSVSRSRSKSPSASSSSTAAAVSQPALSVSTTSTASTTTTPSAAAASATTPAPRRNKLEELRQRRAALKEHKEHGGVSSAFSSAASIDSIVSTESTTTTTKAAVIAAESSRHEIDMLTMQINDMHTTLRKEREETAKLQQKLEAAAEQVAELQQQAVKQADSNQRDPEIQEELYALQREKDDNAAQAKWAVEELRIKSIEWEREKSSFDSQVKELRSSLAMTRQELLALQESTAHKTDRDTSQYKERARMQAEISAQRRKCEQLEREKMDLEAAMEDVTLDKEALAEEKETLEDKLEELRLDAETAQMEAEELKLELEDARAANERITSYDDDEQQKAVDTDVEEMSRALSVQNARLREALIRLREQSSVEKMELTRQLREAEKESSVNKALDKEMTELRRDKAALEEQMNDLKDMVEQGAAFETMVEDLSDRVLSLEEDNVALRATLREMEEAADLTAEMEEVQTEELKELTRDLEGRDTIIRNLEDAIKIQRRREEDFTRTVGNYRSTVATLKQEKKALLELNQGTKGQTSDALKASQNALARAAQLVSDAAEMRRQQAKAVMDRIDYQLYLHMSDRIESILPQMVVSPEVSAIKGELYAGRLVGKAAKTLQGVAASFTKTIRPPLPPEVTAKKKKSDSFTAADETRQKVTIMNHQTEFAQLIVEISSEFVKYLAAGQWPDLLSLEGSMELGSIVGHSASELDEKLGVVLKSLKEEGALTPEQSNLGGLRQSFVVSMQGLKSDVEREDRTLLDAHWAPPGWQLMRDACLAKFSCRGAAAALSTVLHLEEQQVAPPATFFELYSQLEQASSQSAALSLRLVNLDICNATLVAQLSTLATEWKESSMALHKSIQALLLRGGDLAPCAQQVGAILSVLTKLSSAMRSAKLHAMEHESFHALSPESDNTWASISSLCRAIRRVDGDEEDVNFLARARAIETRLAEAIEKEPKLTAANGKLAQLEKTLASRMKEISMQTARLTELEKLLAKSNQGSAQVTSRALDLRSSEEFNYLKEENRVLNEAMEVLQRQVDEYENEIRVLKDFKSPGRGSRARGTPRRGAPLPDVDTSSHRGGSGTGAAGMLGGAGAQEDISRTGSLEATIFRPALQRALADAAKWKAASMNQTMLQLPPLAPVRPVESLTPTALSFGAAAVAATPDRHLLELTSALSSLRLAKAAATRIVDLTKPDPQRQLAETTRQTAAALDRVQSLVQQQQQLRSY